MKIINGIATSATIYNTNNESTCIDAYALAQIKNLCDNPCFKDCTIKIMPDVHPGKVGTIGFTSTIGPMIMPNVIGVDIGCGITLAKIKGRVNEFQKLDTIINNQIPTGCNIRKKPHNKTRIPDLTKLHCYKHINETKAILSLGSLGSGNHFIELDVDEEKNKYLVVHSGSRHLGVEVTEYYLREGQKILKDKGLSIPYELTYLEGELMQNYLEDLEYITNYAAINRELIISIICDKMKFKIIDCTSSIHNYIDFTNAVPIIRKGAISAKQNEKVIIPINMKDGIILGRGKGNKDWNESAPHGAGRIMNRENIKSTHTLSEYKKSMKGIYSSCINKETLDEAPFAYRGIEEIKEVITDTVHIDQILKPIYNFKASN